MSAFVYMAYVSRPSSKMTTLLALHNREREKEGLRPLEYDEGLQKLVCDRANDMSKTDDFSHTKFPDMAPKDAKWYGENLSQDYTEYQALQAWMKSQTHKDNILNPEFKYFTSCESGRYIVVWFKS